ncbi:MAG: hypothetical protein LBT59_18105 [Clostridiales bacterium]|jgi:hypothetical protein|nr:hypothetical protein [Clostridiales bacterium]
MAFLLWDIAADDLVDMDTAKPMGNFEITLNTDLLSFKEITFINAKVEARAKIKAELEAMAKIEAELKAEVVAKAKSLAAANAPL